jgi:hypothetical protein
LAGAKVTRLGRRVYDDSLVLEGTEGSARHFRIYGEPMSHDFGEFWRALEWMGLQRHLKVLGIFCRLKHRDGKPAYAADLPRFFAYATRVALRYRALVPLFLLLSLIERLLLSWSGWIKHVPVSGHHPPEHYASLISLPIILLFLWLSVRRSQQTQAESPE